MHRTHLKVPHHMAASRGRRPGIHKGICQPTQQLPITSPRATKAGAQRGALQAHGTPDAQQTAPPLPPGKDQTTSSHQQSPRPSPASGTSTLGLGGTCYRSAPCTGGRKLSTMTSSASQPQLATVRWGTQCPAMNPRVAQPRRTKIHPHQQL